MIRMARPSVNSIKEDNLFLFLREVGKTRLLKPEETEALVTLAQAGDRKALNRLILGNLRFVTRVCFAYRNRGVPLSDLISEANLGLIRAVEKFDPSQGVKFLSYAVWWIRQGVYLALSKQRGFMSLPPNWFQDRGRIRKAEQKVSQKLGRPPFPEELREETGFSEATLAEHCNSLSALGESQGAEAAAESDPLDRIAGTETFEAPDREIHRRYLRKHTHAALDTLSAREREVIRRAFGISTDHPWTLKEIGDSLGLSRERVRQIKASAVANLKLHNRLSELEEARRWAA